MKKTLPLIVVFFLLYSSVIGVAIIDFKNPPGDLNTIIPLTTLPGYYPGSVIGDSKESVTTTLSTEVQNSITTTQVITSTEPTTRPTTTTLYCGNDMEVCYVENDISGDGIPECCTPNNNPVCRQCLNQCARICHARGEGIKFCFGSNISFGCECTDGKAPTCYTTTTTMISAQSTLPEVDGGVKESQMVRYVAYFLILAGAFGFIIFYMRKL
jgi:hypothetical protein